MADTPGKKKGGERFELTELFMAKADWKRTYVGTLRTEVENGKKIFRGKIKVDECIMLGMAADDREKLFLGMDDMVKLKLDHGLHEKAPIGEEGTMGFMGCN